MRKFLVFILITICICSSGQEVSKRLQQSFIWSGETDKPGSFTVFRKTFLTEQPKSAVLNIFADVRYILWINGNQVLRGPCRFDPKAPQYDFIDIAKYLKDGKNVISVLVMAHGSNGKMMDHIPGLSVYLDIKGEKKDTEIYTDETWLWNNRTKYLPAYQWWGFICDRIDARLDDGDWTAAEYDDSKWQKSTRINGNNWGVLTARQIPLLSQINVPAKPLDKRNYPFKIGWSTIIEVERMVQGYAEFDFETTGGNAIIFEFGYTTDSINITFPYLTNNIYIAKQGRQKFLTTESYGFRYIRITTFNEPLKVFNIKVTDCRYPYVEAGRFSCNDTFLNKLWEYSANTIRMNSEDGYMDCALREKAEWMGDAAVVEYPVSRVIFGYASDGKTIKSDAGLMKNMIRHIALSQSDSGTFKAHHPSDRHSAHEFIEDYSCLWVQSLRQVYDNTQDIKLVKDEWPSLQKQIQWFLNHRTKNGLLKAREFVNFDNPIAYVKCEGATLNAFLYKALIDAAYLANRLGDEKCENLYSNAAKDLYKSYNAFLWIEEKETYSAGLYEDRKMAPTDHAAVLALYYGLVPAERIKGVYSYMKANYNNSYLVKSLMAVNSSTNKYDGKLTDEAFDYNTQSGGINMPYTAFWLLSNLFDFNDDSLALKYIRKNWTTSMFNPQTKTLNEKFGGRGDLCHNFGAVPAYFLSTRVLGVSTLLPVSEHQIQIKPQLGDLSKAEGAVITEYGVINVSWVKSGKKLNFKIDIPDGVSAKVYLYTHLQHTSVEINGHQIKSKKTGDFINFDLKGGSFVGTVETAN